MPRRWVRMSKKHSHKESLREKSAWHPIVIPWSMAEDCAIIIAHNDFDDVTPAPKWGFSFFPEVTVCLVTEDDYDKLWPFVGKKRRVTSFSYLNTGCPKLWITNLEERTWNKLRFEMDSLLFLRLIDHVTRTRKKKETTDSPQKGDQCRSFPYGTPQWRERDRNWGTSRILGAPMNYILQLNEFTRWQRSDSVFASVPFFLPLLIASAGL